jgi:hypothetical protein
VAAGSGLASARVRDAGGGAGGQGRAGRYVVTQRRYLDGRMLLDELARTSDYLAAGLLAAADPAAADFYFPPADDDLPPEPAGAAAGPAAAAARQRRRRRAGTGSAVRVVPVYVLSLQAPGGPDVVDAAEFYAADSRGVVVLQVPLPPDPRVL